MGFRWVLMLIMATVLATPAAAEFYRYRDKSGTIRFTDNLAEVPPEQRANLKAYRESARSPARRAVPEAAASGQAPQPGETPADQKAAEEMATRLRQRQNALIQEHEALEKERAALAQQAGRRVNNAQQARYTEAVETLNAKIREYHQRREAYEREVQAHNARMVERATAKPDSAPTP
jgi:flagellar biosynthesis/type III secretory pathway protein FliH